MRKKDIQHFLKFADDFTFKGRDYKIISKTQWIAMMQDYEK